MSAVPVFYAPDLDASWDVNPGVLTSMNMLAPLQNGAYGSVGKFANILTGTNLTGTDALHAQTFRQASGAVRFLVFRAENIDEYTSAGTRTNRGTGYSASTAAWNAAAWGDQIIACNGIDATQSSTGAGFSALGGGAPIASRIAANLNFVMLADVNDGAGFSHSDAVWWSALQDPTSWTPSLATQAGRIRLLDVPGPIRALVAYRDMFIAFKENAIFVGRYNGPFIFEWTMVSAKIGCVGSKAVTELDGKLYFAHWSGFYEFDGQALRNIGLPVFKNWMKEGNYVNGIWYDDVPPYTPTDYTIQAANFTKLEVDDVEGVVWFCGSLTKTSDSVNYIKMYGYNARTGRWGRFFFSPGPTLSGGSPMLPIRTNYADMQAFSADKDARLWMIMQWTTGATAGGTAFSVAYPYGAYNGSFAQPSFTTGTYSTVAKTTRLKPRHLYGSSAVSTSNISGTVSSWSDEARTSAVQTSASFVANAEFSALDGTCDGKYQKATVTYAAPLGGTAVVLAGIEIDSLSKGRNR
jgi:hypothetical protein